MSNYAFWNGRIRGSSRGTVKQQNSTIIVCCICGEGIINEHPCRHPASTSANREYAHRECLEYEAAYVDDMLAGREFGP